MWKEVIICLTLCMLCFVIGFGSGFSLGVEQTVKEVTIMAQRFVTFEINETLIEEALNKYKYKISGQYPLLDEDARSDWD